ncbi:peroxiredoxin family protein [Oscillatoria salina]|uniref:peroxiredoxin family protein n=1 Tax=Oscillatoria salina TaxID=331517 RepID=UPI0013B781B9|nr:redoxin domain-containing protein [Oscillatoria salina]MBZ8180274.1 redoxin domain-containing protein [Oscillatoria salina IIICB1]NET87764.1 redoxin domain-containing protein [Kamptonema sp. SIO1D9]
MLTSTDLRGLINGRFLRNFIPIPATSRLQLGSKTPEIVLPDITNNRVVRLSEYQGQQPVLLAFTRIFTEKQYCPLCYPHIKELSENYERFTEQGAEVLMITSTDKQQTQQVIKDLGMKMPLLSNPSCDVFSTYETGQALGAPLPAQFILDREGRLRFKHLFSFLDANAGVEKLLKVLADI